MLISQVIQDVDLQRTAVRFAITDAGLVGSDGPIRCGAFDITFMACLPNMIVMAPSDEQELVSMVATAMQVNDGPLCFRFPRGVIALNNPSFRSIPFEVCHFHFHVDYVAVKNFDLCAADWEGKSTRRRR